MIKHLSREWFFMLRQQYIIFLLFVAVVVSGFSVFTGLSEIANQRQTIERLKAADIQDRTDAQAKYDDAGSLAYYSFHLTYSEPSSLAFAALGDRDVYPWKHRIRMLALEGQIYESDAQNAELAQAGKMDFAFVISALSPLFLILLFHDLVASERTSGRHDLLVSTAQSKQALWGARLIVRFVAIFVCLVSPFYIGAIISGTSLVNVILVSLACAIYFAFWTGISIYFGKHAQSAPKIASKLMGAWVLFVFVIPILGDLLIKQSVHSPKGGDILMVQREAVNDAWDLPHKTTMDAFVKRHPEYANYSKPEQGFNWGWYFAFQQVGDQAAESLSADYRDASRTKYETAGFVSVLSPPILIQRFMTRWAKTDAIAALEYEEQIRAFHEQLRQFHYPWLLINHELDKDALKDLPRFNIDGAKQDTH